MTPDHLRRLSELVERLRRPIDMGRRRNQDGDEAADALEVLLARITALEAALGEIVSGEAFREMRFAEDDDAEYFLRAQRKVMRRAQSALQSGSEVGGE